MSRSTANPAPVTESAREALKTFYCELCDRGYARIGEYETHLSRYRSFFLSAKLI